MVTRHGRWGNLALVLCLLLAQSSSKNHRHKSHKKHVAGSNDNDKQQKTSGSNRKTPSDDGRETYSAIVPPSSTSSSSSSSTSSSTMTDSSASEKEYAEVPSTAFASGQTYGTFLFDLDADPYETTDKLTEADAAITYADTIATFRARQKYWANLMKSPELPADNSGKYDLFTACGGYCAYNDADFTPLRVTTKYTYADAPHIVFVLIDDWGWNDVGFRSTYMNWTTPTIDTLAKEGVVLENHYSYELCTPTRGALMTGRYSLRLGLWNENLGELPLSETTLAQELKSAGYRTYMVGKWDLGFSTTQHHPMDRGFDSFYGFYNGMVDYWNKTFLNYRDLHTGRDVVSDPDELSADLHTTYLFQTKAEEAIADHAANYGDQPMFLYYATQLIHGPWSAPSTFLKRCADPRLKIDDVDSANDLRNYCALNVMLDEVVTNLTCALNAHNMGDNTLLVLVSDNGGDSNLKYSGNSYPFKGHKGSVFRGGVSTTAIIHSTLLDERRRGTTFKGNMHITDWLPTLMRVATNGHWTGSLAGAEIDGVDVWDDIQNGDGSRGHKELVFYVNQNSSVIQIGQYKYFYHQFDVGVEEPSFVFRGDLNIKKSTKACTAPSLVNPASGGYTMEIDFSDSFLSFPTPLDVPKTLSGRATAVMVIVSFLLFVVFTLRVYLHSKYSTDAVGSTMTRIKMQSAAQQTGGGGQWAPLLDEREAGGREAGGSAAGGLGPARSDYVEI